MENLPQLAGFDWIVVLIVGAAAAFGLMRGFIAEIASLAGWVAGFVAVRFFYTPASAIFLTASGSETIAAVAAVLGPFLLAVLVVKLIGSFLSSSARNSVIGPVDRARAPSCVAVTTISCVAGAADASSTGRRRGSPAERLISVTVASSKPEATTLTLNGPPTRRPETLNWPWVSVTVRSEVPDGSCVTTTVAPDTGAPFERT